MAGRRLVCLAAAIVFVSCGGTQEVGAPSSVPASTTGSPASTTVATTRNASAVSVTSEAPTSPQEPVVTTTASAVGPQGTPDAGVWRLLPSAPGGSGAFLAWTGREAIVAPGQPVPAADAGDAATELRALDPVTGSWRRFRRSTVAEAATLAAWTGRELLFFGPLASVAYSPADDSWRPVASMPVERGVVAPVAPLPRCSIPSPGSGGSPPTRPC